jgi:hypothetical protein
MKWKQQDSTRSEQQADRDLDGAVIESVDLAGLEIFNAECLLTPEGTRDLKGSEWKCISSF